MFKKKPTTDVEFIKTHLRKDIEYYRTKAEEFRVLSEKEEEPYVKLCLRKTWWQYNNVAVEFESIYWQFEKTNI